MKIFVSYQVQDDPVATSLRRRLRDLPDVSPYQIHLPGILEDPFGRKLFQPDLLYRTLNYPDAAIIILSPHYLADPWFYQEMPALFALEQELRSELIIPVLAAGMTDDLIPHYLRDRHPVDLRERSVTEVMPEFIQIIDQRNSRRTSEVFLIHGHGDTRHVVARFLERLGLKPVILEERPSASSTIIEKLEQHRNVGYAIAILTPDDLGAVRDRAADLQPRPRQNVLFELGFFMGILERHRVCALLSGFAEMPSEFSDFSGVLCVSMEHADWKTQLAVELRAQGFMFDSESLLLSR